MKVEQNYRQPNIAQIKPKADNKGFTTNQQQYKQQNNPNFTGGFDLFLRFLDTNQAWGACAVDLGSMVIPRTAIDMSRNPEAGMETARREGMGTMNHSLVGVYGTLAGLALAMGLNHTYKLGDKNGVKAHSIFADSETLDMQGKIWDAKLKAATGNPNANPLREWLGDTFRNYEALVDGQWVKFKEDDINKTVDILEQEIKSDKKGGMSKDAFANAKNILISSNNVENNIRIIAGEGEKVHSSRYTVDYILGNTYKLGKVFTNDKVKEAFMNSREIAENAFLKAMKSMNIKRSLLGIGMASAVGISAQPLNMYLTKLKTGSDKFVGGGAKDDSSKFKIKKALAAAVFGGGVLATIGNPKNIIKNLQFKGFTPTLNQFKFIYGVTIMSRFLSARNDNELTESSIKDTLGFANWLLLGNFVQKLVAQKLDASLIKREGKGVLNWITSSALKTRDEVLHAGLGAKAFKDGKALSYSEMVKLADPATLKKLSVLKKSQLAGYLYSGIVLGMGIPKLNIYLTNRREAKKAQNAAAKNETQQTSKPQEAENVQAQNEAQDTNQENNMFKPANIQFLHTQKNFTGEKLFN